MTNPAFGPVLAREGGEFVGLQALEAVTFPRRCGCCGQEYASAEEFITATSAPSAKRSGLKQGFDAAGQPIVELFRNCRCGSTLMEQFRDRRETTESGIAHRQRFGLLLDLLKSRALARDLVQSSRGSSGAASRQSNLVTTGASGSVEHQDPGDTS